MLGIVNTAQKPFDIIAHRGATTHRNPLKISPENSLPAFREAHEQGVPVELDVMTTRDGKVIVHHDLKIGRTFKLDEPPKPARQVKAPKTAGFKVPPFPRFKQRHAIRSLSWPELQKATFNREGHEAFINQKLGPGSDYKSPPTFDALKIPSLETVLDELPNTQFRIELKTISPFQNGNLEYKVAKLIKERNLYDRVIVLSFSPLSLKLIKLFDPKIKTALNFNLPASARKNPVLLNGFVNLYAKGLFGVNGLQPSYSDVTPELVQISHKAGLPVIAWVNQETRAEEGKKFPKLIDMGVDGLVTNAVDLLKDEVKRQKVEK